MVLPAEEMHMGQEVDFLQENQLLRISSKTRIKSPDVSPCSLSFTVRAWFFCILFTVGDPLPRKKTYRLYEGKDVCVYVSFLRPRLFARNLVCKRYGNEVLGSQELV